MFVHDFIPERMDEPSSESVSFFLTSMMHDKALTSHAISGHFSFVRLVPTLATGTTGKDKVIPLYCYMRSSNKLKRFL